MDRAKAYSWLLTVVMGIAITTAVKDLSVLVTTQTGTSNTPILPALVRFAIFLLLSIRWTLGALWYFDKAYISKNPPALGVNYFFDFFKFLIGFLIFVPLALTVTSPPANPSPLSSWLNNLLIENKELSAFIWILILLLLYDCIWFVLKCILWIINKEAPRRITAFWAILNLITLLICLLLVFFRAFLGKSLHGAESQILFVILAASIIDILGTIVEDSPLSQRLSP